MTRLPLNTPHDFTFTSEASHAAPFMVDMRATFTHESGERMHNVPAFHSGDNTWTVRFSPPLEGMWTGITASEDQALHGNVIDPFEAVQDDDAPPGLSRGVLGVDPSRPNRFAWEDGTPMVPLGFECDWLFSYHQRDAAQCRRALELVASRGFNYVVTNLYAHTGFSTTQHAERQKDGRPIDDSCVFGPPDLFCFGGTNERPDHRTMNTDFFDRFDDLVRMCADLDLVVHLMIQVQNKHVSWPRRFSPEDDLFWKYVVARYQAFGNLVWDTGKESYYFHKETGSHGYTLDRIEFIRSHDAYGHMVTVHDPAADSPGRNCEVDLACDFVSDQVHLGDTRAYNREAIHRSTELPMPYLNIEYGYERGVDQLHTYTGRTTADWEQVLCWTWALYLGGAYANYYYDNTSWDMIRFDPEPPGWKRHAALRDILGRIPFNAMSPCNELVARGMCLALPGAWYLAFLPEGGDLGIDLSAVHGAERPAGRMDYDNVLVAVEWLSITTLERHEATAQPAGFNTTFANPLPDTSRPCAVLVRV